MAYVQRGEKDRFVLPAKFRKVVEESSGARKLLVSRFSQFDCLVGYGESRQLQIDSEPLRKQEKLEGLDPDFDIELEDLGGSGTVEEMSFDASGRFVFPRAARLLAEIEDEAMLIGAGPQFQIWNPNKLLALDTNVRALRDAQRILPVLREEAEGKV
jgi:MraZ protein